MDDPVLARLIKLQGDLNAFNKIFILVLIGLLLAFVMTLYTRSSMTSLEDRVERLERTPPPSKVPTTYL